MADDTGHFQELLHSHGGNLCSLLGELTSRLAELEGALTETKKKYSRLENYSSETRLLLQSVDSKYHTKICDMEAHLWSAMFDARMEGEDPPQGCKTPKTPAIPSPLKTVVEEIGDGKSNLKLLADSVPSPDLKKSESEYEKAKNVVKMITKSVVPVLHLKSDEDCYEMKESVWDLAMIIGLPEVGTFGSIWSTFLFLLNAAFQLILCLVINDNFAYRQIDDSTVKAMRAWRIDSGHSFKYVDNSGQPLAERICSFDSSVPMSNNVASILGAIADYQPIRSDLDRHDVLMGYWMPYSSGIGRFLCMLCVIIWVLYSAIEIEEIASCAKAIFRIPLGNNVEGAKPLTFVTVERKIFCSLALCLKGFVAAMLCLCGTLFLSFTIHPQDLLLNAAALQMVLDLDEVIYAAMVPLQASLVLKSIQPLVKHPTPNWKGLGPKPIMVVLAVIIVLILSYAVVLGPQSNDLAAARAALCDGRHDFIVVHDSAGVVMASPTAQDHAQQFDYRDAAVQQLIVDPSALDSGYAAGSLSGWASSVFGGPFSLHYRGQLDSKASANSYNPYCLDLLDFQDVSGRFFRRVLEEAVGFTATTCESAKSVCNADTPAGVRARQFCSRTCGCIDPGSSLVVAITQSGCPESCSLHPFYQDRFKSRNCTNEEVNSTMDADVNSSLFKSYIEGLESTNYATDPSMPTLNEDLKILTSAMRSLGCAAVHANLSMTYPWPNLCELYPSWYLKPMTYVCPQTCECAIVDRLFCPPRCANPGAQLQQPSQPSQLPQPPQPPVATATTTEELEPEPADGNNNSNYSDQPQPEPGTTTTPTSSQSRRGQQAQPALFYFSLLLLLWVHNDRL